MEISQEVIEKLGLNEDQVKGISDFGKDVLATEQQKWDGKANENAEGILSGVIKSTQGKFGVTLDRNQGEKHADYLLRLSETILAKGKSEVEKLKTDYESKLKDFKGGDTLKSELDAAKAKLDEALQKYSDYDTVKEKAEKAEEYGKQLSGLKLEVAFNGVKPSFPDNVNQYEAKAKWDDFKAKVLESGTIEIVDGVAMVIDKENQYKQSKLSDLVAKDETLSELLKGRQQAGLGSRPSELKTIDGVEFKVPVGADTKQISELVKEHLTKDKGLVFSSPEYSKQFAELFKKIKQKTAA